MGEKEYSDLTCRDPDLTGFRQSSGAGVYYISSYDYNATPALRTSPLVLISTTMYMVNSQKWLLSLENWIHFFFVFGNSFTVMKVHTMKGQEMNRYARGTPEKEVQLFLSKTEEETQHPPGIPKSMHAQVL